jgi:hypothetical protein
MSKTTANEIKITKTTRKIGRTTYVVFSTYADSNQHDLVSTIARLIQLESTLISVAETAKSA